MKPLEEIFRERLLKAMCENNVTIQEVADGANCCVNFIKATVEDRVAYTPPIEVVIRNSKYLNCSLEYLLGLTEQYEFIELEKPSAATEGNRKYM